VVRRLKRLEDAIPITVVDWLMTEDGWHFSSRDGATPDPNVGATFLRDVYRASDPHFTGRVSVPLLWDRKEGAIVHNESSEIVRMLNREFDAFGDASLDLYPEALRPEIDAINAFVYDRVDNGVYKCGFAGTQAAYEEAFEQLFGALDELEHRLSGQRYLVGARRTEADWRLFTTLVRFDAVYFGHFKCNRRRIVDYPNLWGYLRELHQVPGIAQTVDLHHIKSHYDSSHRSLNPLGIVPRGPELDFTAPHDRARLPAAG
jgi:putative glutathione S-transferase